MEIRGNYMQVSSKNANVGVAAVADDEAIINELTRSDLFGFFMFGIINNTSYVIMIAGAKEIDASMVGLIYLCGVVPSFLCKLSGPYWYHLLSYRRRVILSTFLMMGSFISVAIGATNKISLLQLFGVVLGSAQSGIGEASFLALSAYYNPSRKALTAWSSGTGFAGIIGYGWVVAFTQGIKASFPTTMWIALIVFPISYFLTFEVLMGSPQPEVEAANNIDSGSASGSASARGSASGSTSGSSRFSGESTPKFTGNPLLTKNANTSGGGDIEGVRSKSTNNTSITASVMNRNTTIMTLSQRLHATLNLWPYMVPLCVVYAAEYTLQSGVWSAMGFPITDSNSRKLFYEYSNWIYQLGVVCSRSSGTLWTPTRTNLWLMPCIQILFLIFSIYNAYHQLWYDWSILILCFCVGLLGGAVYVGGFSLIAIESSNEMKEFNLSAASVADSVGISVANICGIFIQKAVYKYYDISDN
jgi:battenin